MKCPKCETENENRSVCKKCGMFLYRPDYRNAPKLSMKQLKQRDRRTIWLVAKKVLRIVGILTSIFVLTFWFFILVFYFFGT